MSGSVAIVTGASSGIGKATAVRLAQAFASLVIVAREGENLAAVAECAKKIRCDCLPLEMDLSMATN